MLPLFLVLCLVADLIHFLAFCAKKKPIAEMTLLERGAPPPLATTMTEVPESVVDKPYSKKRVVKKAEHFLPPNLEPPPIAYPIYEKIIAIDPTEVDLEDFKHLTKSHLETISYDLPAELKQCPEEMHAPTKKVLELAHAADKHLYGLAVDRAKSLLPPKMADNVESIFNQLIYDFIKLARDACGTQLVAEIPPNLDKVDEARRLAYRLDAAVEEDAVMRVYIDDENNYSSARKDKKLSDEERALLDLLYAMHQGHLMVFCAYRTKKGELLRRFADKGAMDLVKKMEQKQYNYRSTHMKEKYWD